MDYNTIINDIIKALIPVAITVIGALGAKLVQVVGHSKKLTFLKELAQQAVQQAEEEGYSIPNFTSADKLDSAISFLVKFAAAHGVKVSESDASALVLSAVAELHQVQQAMGGAPLPAEPPVAPVTFQPYEAPAEDTTPPTASTTEAPAPAEAPEVPVEAPAEGAQGSSEAPTVSA